MGIIGPLLMSTAVMTAAPVALETLDGARMEGELVRLNTDEAAIQVQQQQRTIPTEQLRWLRSATRDSSPDTEPVQAWIELTDGSRLNATGYQVDGARRRLAWREMSPCNCPHVRYASCTTAARRRSWTGSGRISNKRK